jgi:hypothetical protein
VPAFPKSQAAPPRPADPAAKTARLSAEETPPVLLSLPSEQPAEASSAEGFVLLLPDRSGALFLQHGRSRVLPLFTGRAEAVAFLVRARLSRYTIAELPTVEAVAEFLRSPPGLAGGAADYLVAVDPEDPIQVATGLFSPRQLIAALGCDPP